MDMPVASRAAVLNRLAAVIPLAAERPAVKAWSDLSVTEQMLVELNDSQLASVLKNQMSASTELEVLSGKFADQAPAVLTPEQQRAQAVADWCEAHPVVDPYEAVAATNRQVLEQQRAVEMERQVSAEIANRVLQDEASYQRGW
jgi:hypothetical protein